MNAPQALQTSPHPARFTVDEFLRLDDTGVFEKYSKTELIEGEIICMNAQYSRHARVKSQLLRALGNALELLGSDLEAWAEVSVQLDDDSLPEPDIVLTRHKGNGVVPLDSVALIVEVSDTTLQHDLGRKAELYARAGVPEYWVVDVTENRVLLHSGPVDGDYPGQWDVPFGEPLHSLTIAGLSVDSGRLE